MLFKNLIKSIQQPLGWWVVKSFGVFWVIFFTITMFVSSCASSGDKKASSEDQASAGDDGDSYTSQRSKTSAGKMIFGGTIISSISNNPLVSQQIDTQVAIDHAITLRSQQNPTEQQLIEAISAARLGNVNTSEILSYANQLMKVRVKNNVKDLPEIVKLEIGLTSIQDKNLARARIFLDPLLRSTKNMDIKAAIHNAFGVAALQIDDYSSAVGSFKQSLKYRSNYPPALFNIGFLSLRYGYYSRAQQYLSSLQEDWYAKVGVMSADRHTKKDSRASSACDRLVQSKPKNKIVLFNCGLFYFQNLGNVEKARDLIESATQEAYGEENWDEIAFRVMESLQQ